MLWQILALAVSADAFQPPPALHFGPSAPSSLHSGVARLPDSDFSLLRTPAAVNDLSFLPIAPPDDLAHPQADGVTGALPSLVLSQLMYENPVFDTLLRIGATTALALFTLAVILTFANIGWGFLIERRMTGLREKLLGVPNFKRILKDEIVRLDKSGLPRASLEEIVEGKKLTVDFDDVDDTTLTERGNRFQRRYLRKKGIAPP